MEPLLVTEPIVGWKRATLKAIPGHLPGEWVGFRFWPESAQQPYGPDATAVCRGDTPTKHVDHPPWEAPHPDCTCGFYAFPAPDMAPPIRPARAQLKVALSGRVFEREMAMFGGTVYVAERQRVQTVTLPSTCVRDLDCGPAAYGWVYEFFDGEHIASDVVPICRRCALDTPAQVIEPDLIAAMLGANLEFAEPGTPGRHLGAVFSGVLLMTQKLMDDMVDALDAMERFALVVDRTPGPSVRQDDETALDWKRRRDRERAAMLDRIEGPRRPPQGTHGGRRPGSPRPPGLSRTRAR